jgi:hypothetical protein
MKKNENTSLIPSDRIADKILFLRGEKVILDFQIAELYGIETRTLKQAVKRNPDRFPNDFMFKLNQKETDRLVSQNVIPSKSHLGGATPFAFTENGVAMLSGVLKTKNAIEVNLAIMRTFVKLRRIHQNFEEIQTWKSEIEKTLSEHANQILLLFEYLKQIEETKRNQLEQQNRQRIGFKP